MYIFIQKVDLYIRRRVSLERRTKAIKEKKTPLQLKCFQKKEGTSFRRIVIVVSKRVGVKL